MSVYADMSPSFTLIRASYRDTTHPRYNDIHVHHIYLQSLQKCRTCKDISFLWNRQNVVLHQLYNIKITLYLRCAHLSMHKCLRIYACKQRCLCISMYGFMIYHRVVSCTSNPQYVRCGMTDSTPSTATSPVSWLPPRNSRFKKEQRPRSGGIDP